MGSAVLVDNFADDADTIITVESEASSMPASQLQGEHVLKRWRSELRPSYIIADLGAVVDMDTFGLFGMTPTAAATVRLRVSSVDATGAAGDILDTGDLTASSQWFDYRYGAFVYAAPAVLAGGQYVRIDLDDSGADFVQAGRLVIGERIALDYNFTPGSNRGWEDLSRTVRARGGSLLTDRRPKFRTLDFNFDQVTAAQWAEVWEKIDREKGTTNDILFLVDPESDNVARDSIWGTLTDNSPAVFTAVVGVLTRQFRLQERL